MCVRARASLVACVCVRACTRVHGHVRVLLHHSVRKGGKAGPHHLSATSLTETLITGLYTSLHHTHHGLTHSHTHTHAHTHSAVVVDCGTSYTFRVRFFIPTSPLFSMSLLLFSFSRESVLIEQRFLYHNQSNIDS